MNNLHDHLPGVHGKIVDFIYNVGPFVIMIYFTDGTYVLIHQHPVPEPLTKEYVVEEMGR